MDPGPSPGGNLHSSLLALRYVPARELRPVEVVYTLEDMDMDLDLDLDLAVPTAGI